MQYTNTNLRQVFRNTCDLLARLVGGIINHCEVRTAFNTTFNPIQPNSSGDLETFCEVADINMTKQNNYSTT